MRACECSCEKSDADRTLWPRLMRDGSSKAVDVGFYGSTAEAHKATGSDLEGWAAAVVALHARVQRDKHQ
jgi:hypothetical protein